MCVLLCMCYTNADASLYRSNMETTLDEGLGVVADVNVALVTRLILHITDTQLPVKMMYIK